MPNFDRKHDNGSIAKFRGPWAFLVRLENVPRFERPVVPEGHEVMYIGANWTTDDDGKETITGYHWHCSRPHPDVLLEFYDIPTSPVNRHSFNVRMSGYHACYPHKRLWLWASNLMGGWYLQAGANPRSAQANPTNRTLG